jgi:hypothetical protein
MSKPNPDHSSVPPHLWRRWVRTLLNRRWSAEIGRLALDGYLAQSGWLRSMQERRVMDAQGRPIPWCTLPFVDFITPRLQPGWRIFEYGAGASTHYYSARAAQVWTVEHDAAFAAELKSTLPANARLLVYPENSDSYVEAIDEMPGAADYVSVDGRDRVRCVQRGMTRLSAQGVLVLDDAERPQYAPEWQR